LDNITLGNQPVILESYLTEDEVELVLRYPTKIQKPAHNPLMLGAFGYETSLQASQISMENPVTQLTGNPEDDESILKFTSSVLSVVGDMEKFFGIEMSITNCNYVVMLPGAGIPVHADDSFLDGTPYHENEETEYSAIIYLNTSGVDYKGGEISFPLQDVVVAPKTGMVVFFKGDYHLPHGVSTIESGERKTIVIFCARKGNISDRPLFSDEHSGVPKEEVQG
jgi:hypothetical protein